MKWSGNFLLFEMPFEPKISRKYFFSICSKTIFESAVYLQINSWINLLPYEWKLYSFFFLILTFFLTIFLYKISRNPLTMWKTWTNSFIDSCVKKGVLGMFGFKNCSRCCDFMWKTSIVTAKLIPHNYKTGVKGIV